MTNLARRMAAITPFRVVDVMEAAWAAERAGRDIVHLEVGEPDFGTPAPVVEAASKAIADGRVRYTSSLGIPELREAISGYYADRFGVDVPARRMVVTTGASGALLLALAATVDRDDEVLLADPGYPCNRNLIRMCEGEPVGIPVGAAHRLPAHRRAGRRELDIPDPSRAAGHARPTPPARWCRPANWPPSPQRRNGGAGCASSTRSTANWSTTGHRPRSSPRPDRTNQARPS